MLLHTITTIAERIQGILSPYCRRIAIAGSIRRACPECNDIDLVLMPSDGQEADLRVRCKQRAATIICDGPAQLIIRLSTGLQVDFYFTHPEQKDLLTTIPTNWGSVLLCRTGSREHNIHLASQAKRLGLHWDPPHGLRDDTGRVIASATEEEIYQTLGLEFLPPVYRSAQHITTHA